MIAVHHLDYARSQRLPWRPEKLAQPGEPPVATTDDGLMRAEAGAILEALRARHGQGCLALARGGPDGLLR